MQEQEIIIDEAIKVMPEPIDGSKPVSENSLFRARMSLNGKRGTLVAGTGKNRRAKRDERYKTKKVIHNNRKDSPARRCKNLYNKMSYFHLSVGEKRMEAYKRALARIQPATED